MRSLRSTQSATIFAALALVAGCASHGGGAVPATTSALSPALIPAAPMAKTAIQPASAMLGRHPKADAELQSLDYTQIPGSASALAAAPDGSLWVLSDQPAGPDKYIWHYVNGTWTNISGLASRIAVSRDSSTLWAINSGGGIWSYSGGTWSSPGGGASDITTDYYDGTIYVVSNAGPGPDRAIFQYDGVWSQSQGSGVRVIASFDTGGYGWLTYGGQGGTYVLNAAGNIYHEYAGQTGFDQLPGAASDLTATTDGGYFVLGYPANPAGSTIYYFNLDGSQPTYTTELGSGVAISTNSLQLYVLSASGAIYAAPVAVKPDYAFGGASAQADFVQGQTTPPIDLAAYRNVTLTITTGTVTSGSGTLTLRDAFNDGDITPAAPVDNATTGYTPVVYLSFENPGPGIVSVGSDSPGATLKKTDGFGGATSCELDVYGSQGEGQGKSWFALPGASATISGDEVTIPSVAIPNEGSVDFEPGQTIVAISCH